MAADGKAIKEEGGWAEEEELRDDAEEESEEGKEEEDEEAASFEVVAKECKVVLGFGGGKVLEVEEELAPDSEEDEVFELRC